MMLSKIEIDGFVIENGGRPFIMAEVGLNHNGELDKAFEMIHVAKDAGVDAVKFQTFKAENIVNNPEQTYTYKSQGKEVTEPMLEMFRRCELPENVWKDIKKECEKTNVMFLSTPQDRCDLDILLKIGVPAVKVGSDDFTNIPLLKSYAETKLPLILSCGMADMSEVYQALNAVGAFDGYPVIQLLCTSEYPAPPESVNLNKLKTLQSAFPGLPIGFSDHTQGHIAAAGAAILGACVFEKHFTLDHNLPGPDHWFAADPIELKEWVDAIRTGFQMTGSAVIRPTEGERINKIEFKRYIVAARDIKAGEVFSMEDFEMKRVPKGNGFLPAFAEEFVGRKASKDFAKGEALSF